MIVYKWRPECACTVWHRVW